MVRIAIKMLHLMWLAAQWTFVVAFVLLAVDTLQHSQPFVGTVFLIIAALITPPTRHWLRKATQGKMDRKWSLVAASSLFVVALAMNPEFSKPVETQQENTLVPVTASQSSERPRVTILPKKDVQIERIKKQKWGYDVEGYGPVNTGIVVELANGQQNSTTTNHDGWFVVTLMPGAAPYGTMTLKKLQDNNSYETIHGIYYYTFFANQPILSDKLLHPVVTKVIKNGDKMDIEGFSEPKSKIVMIYKDIELAKADVNDDGYFVFKSVDKKEHFMQLTFLHDATRGLSRVKYVDTTVFTLNDSLPRWTKKISANEAIAFTTRENSDSGLASGQRKVTQEGENGSKTVYYNVSYIGAEEVGRVVEREIVTLQPVEKVVAVGTYVAPPPTYFASPSPSTSTYYANCTEAKAAGAAPIYRGEPGYGTHLDRDGDGVACER